MCKFWFSNSPLVILYLVQLLVFRFCSSLYTPPIVVFLFNFDLLVPYLPYLLRAGAVVPRRFNGIWVLINMLNWIASVSFSLFPIVWP